MAHRFLIVPPHLSGTVPCVELPSGRGSLPFTVVHAFQRDAHACSLRSFVDHGIPCLSSGSAPGGDVMKGVITPSACACVHTPPQQRLHRVWYDPPALSHALRAASAASPMPQVLRCSLCKRYATPRSRPHTEARTAWR